MKIGFTLPSERKAGLGAAMALLALASLTACSRTSGPGAPAMTPQATVRAAAASASTSVTASVSKESESTVTVSKGSSAVGQPGCTAASCAYIVATTAGFSGTVTCSPDSTNGKVGWVTWTQGPNEKKQSPDYYGYPSTQVTVTCTGGGQSASGSITW